jgi:hypothetical protein
MQWSRERSERSLSTWQRHPEQDRPRPTDRRPGPQSARRTTAGAGLNMLSRPGAPRPMHPGGSRRRQCRCSLRPRGCRVPAWGWEPAETGRYPVRRFSIRSSRRSCRRAFLSGRSMAERMVSVMVTHKNAEPNTKAITSSVLMHPILGPRAQSHPLQTRIIGAQTRRVYSSPSSLTAAMTSGTWTASRAGSGWVANVSPRRSSARVRTTWGPGGGPQISGGAGPKSTTEGVP